MGEQFLGQFRWLGDRHRGGQRQAFQQALDLFDLHPHTAFNPRLLHQVVVFGGQIDRINDAPLCIQQPAGTGQEHDLVRLQNLYQFVGGKIGIDVENLPAHGLTQ